MQRARNELFRPYKGDELLVVEFFAEEVKDEVESTNAGYPVFKDEHFVRVSIPGDKQTNITSRAFGPCTMPDGTRTTYAERFPDDYERFQKGLGAAVSGLHLKHAPFLTKGEVATMAAQNIFTVEQLADLGGQPLRSLGPKGREWQQKAVAFLDAAKGSRDATADAAEIAALKAELAALRGESDDDEANQKAALKDELEALTGHRPKGNPSIKSLQSMLEEAKK